MELRLRAEQNSPAHLPALGLELIRSVNLPAFRRDDLAEEETGKANAGADQSGK